MKRRYLLITLLAAGCAYQATGDPKQITVNGHKYWLAPSAVYGTCSELLSEHLFTEAGEYVSTRSGAGSNLFCALAVGGEIGGLGVVAAKAIRPSNTNVTVEQS